MIGLDTSFATPLHVLARRETESSRLGTWMLWGCVAAVIFSVLDAYLTLNVLGRGASEANPVMRAALGLGDGAFVVLKTAITAVGVAILFRLRHLPVARTGMLLVVTGYVGLMCYHAYGQVIHAHAAIGLPV